MPFFARGVQNICDSLIYSDGKIVIGSALLLSENVVCMTRVTHKPHQQQRKRRRPLAEQVTLNHNCRISQE